MIPCFIKLSERKKNQMKPKALLFKIIPLLLLLFIMLVGCEPTNPDETGTGTTAATESTTPEGEGTTTQANGNGTSDPSTCQHANTTTLNAKAATCAETGYSGDTYCNDCKNTIATGQTIEKLTTHGETEVRNAQAATCSEFGYSGDTYCKLCETKIADGARTDKLPHGETETRNAKAATCGDYGYTGEQYCKGCNTKLQSGTLIEKQGEHSTVTVTRNDKAATCGVDGYTGDQYCTVCNKKVASGVAIPATGEHSYNGGKETKPATCYADGEWTKTCTVCSDTKIDPITTRPNHTLAYTDLEDGVHHHVTCSVRGCNYPTQTVEHTPTDAGVHTDGNCIDYGYTTHTCRDCRATYTVNDAQAPAGQHTYGAPGTVEATCQATGLTTRTCSVCSHVEETVLPINPNRHTMQKVDSECVAPSCNEQGKIVERCACGYDKVTTLHKTAHNYVEDTEATATGSWKHSVCEGCGNKVSQFVAENPEETKAEVTVNEIPTDKSFEITLGSTKIEFPTEVIEKMQNAETVEIAADVVVGDTKTNLINKLDDENKKQSLANGNLYDFSAGSIDKFGDETNTVMVRVSVHYELGPNESADGIVIWYIDGDGVLHEVTNVSYDATTKTATFEVSHFSYYAIAYHETQEMLCARGVHNWDKVAIVVDPTCYTGGYTVETCLACHTKNYSAHTAPLTHKWSVSSTSPVSCDKNGYTVMTCEHCQVSMQTDIIPATGHNYVGVADCVNSATCTFCNAVIPATGHRWGEWETIKVASATEYGLERRYCENCSEYEDKRIAPTGLVDPIEVNSYQDLAELLLEKVLGFGEGIISYEMNQDDMTITLNAVVSIEEDGTYLIYITGTITDVRYTENSDGTMRAEPIVISDFKAVYRDGSIAVVDESGKQPYYFNTDLESLLEMNCFFFPFDSFMETFENIFSDIVNPTVENAYAFASNYLQNFLDTYGDFIDRELTASGSSYTSADLVEILESLETVYTYTVLKLGLNTNLEMNDHVNSPLPTREDLFAVLKLFCRTESDEAGNTKYIIDADSDIARAVNTIFDLYTKYAEGTVGDMLFDIYRTDINGIYPDVTSWSEFETELKKLLPGTTTATELIDMIVNSGYLTLDEFYALVNAIVDASSEEPVPEGEGFNCEEYLTANPELTLDDLLYNILGVITEDDPTTEEIEIGIYDEISNYFKTLVKDLVVGVIVEYKQENVYDQNGNVIGGKEVPIETPVTMAEAIIKLYQAWNSFEIAAADFELHVNANGQVIYLNIDALISMLYRESEDAPSDGVTSESGKVESMPVTVITESQSAYGAVLTADGTTDNSDTDEPIRIPLVDAEITIDRTEPVTPNVPETLLGVLDNFGYHYDEEGNLIVTGLKADIDYQVKITGSKYRLFLADIVTLNNEMSSMLKRDVYMTDIAYAYDKREIATYFIDADGNLYEQNKTEIGGHDGIVSSVSMKDLKNDYTCILPAEGTEPDGKIQGTESFGYYTAIGVIYQDAAGVWQLALDAKRDWIHTEGGRTEYIFYVGNVLSLESAVETLALSSIDSSGRGYYDEDGNWNDAAYAYFHISEEENAQTLCANILIENSEIIIVYIDYIPSKTYITPGNKVEAPEHDFVEYWADKDGYALSDSVILVDANGNPLGDEYDFVTFSVKAPKYFYKYDNLYFNINNHPFVTLNKAVGDPIQIADGRTFYCVGTETLREPVETGDGRMVTSVKIGYFHVSGNEYIRATVSYMNDGTQYDIRYLTENYSTRIRPTGTATIDVTPDMLVTLECTRLDDGSYKISVELLNQLRALMKNPGDGFTFLFYYEDKTTGNNVMHNAGMERLPFDAASLFANDEAETFYLNNSPSYYYNQDQFEDLPYDTTVNSDGSVSVEVHGQDKVELEIIGKPSGSIAPPDNALVLDETRTAASKFDVYAYDRYTAQEVEFILLNNKYYNFYTQSNYVVQKYTAETLETLSAELQRNFRLSNIRLQYEDAGVYYAEMHTYSGSHKIYLQIDNGMVYVLTDLVENGDASITWESRVLLNDFISGLHYEFQEGHLISNYTLYNGKAVYYTYLREMCGDESLSDDGRYTYYIYNGDEIQLIDFSSNDRTQSTSVVLTGNGIDLPAFYGDTTTTKRTYTNGTYTFVRGVQLVKYETSYFVKLNGVYYLYNSDFKRHLQTEENALSQLKGASVGTLAYRDPTMVGEVRTYYERDENGAWVPYTSGKFDDKTHYLWGDTFEKNDEIVLDDGMPIYLFYVYDISGITREEVNGEVYLYNKDVIDSAYLSVTDNDGVRHYISANRYTDTNGQYVYNLSMYPGYEPVTREYEALVIKYVSVNDNVITFSKEFLDMLGSRLSQTSFRVKTTDGMSIFAIAGSNLKKAIDSANSNVPGDNNNNNGSSGNIIIKPGQPENPGFSGNTDGWSNLYPSTDNNNTESSGNIDVENGNVTTESGEMIESDKSTVTGESSEMTKLF